MQLEQTTNKSDQVTWLNQYLAQLSTSSNFYVEREEHLEDRHHVHPPIPVWQPTIVDPSMVPSTIFIQHPSSAPSSPSYSVAEDDSDGFPGFRAGDRAQRPDPWELITAEAAPTTPAPLLIHDKPLVPVALPIHAPQWTDILAANPGSDPADATDLFRIVEDDSKRVYQLKEIERLREQNRRAVRAGGRCLVPIPSKDGTLFPHGYREPITSVFQLNTMSLAELNTWLSYYGLRSSEWMEDEDSKRQLLGSLVGASPRHLKGTQAKGDLHIH